MRVVCLGGEGGLFGGMGVVCLGGEGGLFGG